MTTMVTMKEHVAAYLLERSMLGFSVSGPNAQLLSSLPISLTSRTVAG
ncbi:hypothetical protein [Sinorhizobium meliloti]|nr:hypothetical protein [Sinorhizobium meliloti]